MVANFQNISNTKFSLNGIEYPKIFLPVKVSETHLRIVNVYDWRFQILEATRYDDILVDGSSFGSIGDALNAVAALVYSKTSITGADIVVSEDAGNLIKEGNDGGAYLDIVGSIEPKPPVDGTYANVSALIADQNSQEVDYFYEVTDASGFTAVTSGTAVVILNATTGAENDYTILWSEQDQPLTAAAINTALGYDLFQALEAKANDSEVVKTIETADGQILEMDENGKVVLPDFSTEGGAEVHTVFTDTIWNEGDSLIFPVSDSSKVTDVSVQGIGAREGFEWEKYSATEIRIIMDLDPGNWVLITGSNVSAPAYKTDVISYALSSPSADLAAGDTDSFIAPYDFTLNNYFAGVAEAPTGSALVVGLKKNGTSVTSSDAIIDSGETSSLTGTDPVLTGDLTFTKGTKITPTIQQVGSLSTGKSLKIYLEITKL